MISNSCKKEDIPSVTTVEVSSLGQTSVSCGGTITSEGGSAVISRGVCWGTNDTPKITDSKTTDGAGAGSFTSAITGLNAGTKYFVRAYATNGKGTGYGMAMSFTTTPATAPSLTTADVTAITPISAVSGGSIGYDGASPITACGVCWSTSTTPTIADNKTIDATGTGTFTSNLTGLNRSTQYYIRAYATNVVGTSYGQLVGFATKSIIPAISTTIISSIAFTTASSGGNITSDGGATVTSSGVCWSIAPNPTIANNKTTSTTINGGFTSNLIGLVAGTTYYVRAYATNLVGTAYGNELSFKTLSAIIPVLNTSVVTSITLITATSGGNITNDGGSPVTARGVCWSTTAGPTIGLNTKTTDNAGTGLFISSLNGLIAGTVYYVRAYATNIAGTGYGNEIIFSTSAAGPVVTDIDGNLYGTIIIGTQTWMSENLKTTKYNDGTAIPFVTVPSSWAALYSPGYCWYNNDEGTYKGTYGALYNGYVVNQTNSKKVCPSGWHVPTDAEWRIMASYLGGANYAGGKLKETGLIHWLTPNTGATNETGFIARPGGFRNIDGTFAYIGSSGYWWTSSTDNSTTPAIFWYINYDIGYMFTYHLNSQYGRSIRCLHD
jgi:uncharacterized protein (TIGR02145 family)